MRLLWAAMGERGGSCARGCPYRALDRRGVKAVTGREALVRYGRHDSRCPIDGRGLFPHEVGASPFVCTCGFSAALTEAARTVDDLWDATKAWHIARELRSAVTQRVANLVNLGCVAGTREELLHRDIVVSIALQLKEDVRRISLPGTPAGQHSETARERPEMKED